MVEQIRNTLLGRRAAKYEEVAMRLISASNAIYGISDNDSKHYLSAKKEELANN